MFLTVILHKVHKGDLRDITTSMITGDPAKEQEGCSEESSSAGVKGNEIESQYRKEEGWKETPVVD